jgi:TonB-dependent starch-binding outer membrane protein SusC
MKKNILSIGKYSLCMVLSAFISQGGYSQSTASLADTPADKKSLQKEAQKSLKQALSEIEAQHNAFIIYNLQAVENKFVTGKADSSAKIEETLHTLLAPLGLKYERINENVFVIVLPEEQKGNQDSGAMGAGDMPPLEARTYQLGTETPRAVAKLAFRVTGRVTSRGGEALPGVNVVVRGTAIGATTGADGNYSLEAPDGEATLVFSYIGFLSKEVPINNQSTLNVTLSPDVQGLKEVQIVGYGTQQKREVTSAISTVTAQQIQDMPIIGLDQALQGRAPGVQVTNNSGTPGGGVSIRIRGSSSLTGSNEPLYVVDGVPINNTQTFNQQTGEERINPLSNLNPADIESMEILKDAASTSIYGARAANGVVLITTKRGIAGQPSVDIESWYGLSQVANRYDLLGASDFATKVNEGRASINQPPIFSPAVIANPPVNTDWQDAIFRTAPTANVNLSTRGGSERTQYMLSAGYMDQQGVIIESRFRRYNMRINLDQQLGDRIRIGNNLTTSYTINNRIRNTGAARADGGDQNNLFGSPVLSTAHARSPLTPVRDAAGNYSFDPLAPIFPNPVAMAEAQDITNHTLRVIGNVFAELDIARGLRFRTTLGTDVRYENEDFFFPPFPGALQGNGTGRGSERNFNEVLWLTENYLTYDFNIGEDHNFSALAGASFQESQLRSSFVYVSEFGSERIRTLNGGTQVLQATSNAESWGIASYFGRMNYNFRGKYLFQVNARVDGSSRFGAANRYGFFPSASVGWNVSDEPWMQAITQLNMLKLRASYGITGNQEIGNYSHIGTFGIGGGANQGRNYLGLGAVANNIPNDDFSWEETAQFNIGTDIGVFNNRINLTADYYIKTTTGLLLNIPIPRTSGFNSTLTNIGSMENRGFEIGINTVNLEGEFRWMTDFNFSMNRNKVLSLVGNQDIRVQESIVRVGHPISFYLFEREPFVNPATGTTVLIDRDGSGTANDADRTIMGSPLPLHIGGFNNTFTYRGFDLNIFFQWSYGNMIYNRTRQWIEELRKEQQSTIGYNTTQRAFDNRWREEGDVTTYPGVFYDLRNQQHFLPHNGWLEDGSYLRLKTLTFGYSLPAAVSQRLRMSRARVYFSSNNLLTFTRYLGYDPEVSHFTSQGPGGNIGVGYDHGTYPQPRTLVLGVNLSF